MHSIRRPYFGIRPKMLEPVRTIAPATEPLTAAVVKANLKIETSDDDAFVASLIKAATAKLDGWNGDLGRCLVPQTWRVDFDRFPLYRDFPVPIGPATTVAVQYYDSDNVQQTFDAANYALHEDGRGTFLWLDQTVTAWPGTYWRADAVSLTVTAGYPSDNSPEDGSGVPEEIKLAIQLMIGHWYENRQEVVVDPSRVSAVEIPKGADFLLANYRYPRF